MTSMSYPANVYPESGLIFTPPKISHTGRHCVGWHAGGVLWCPRMVPGVHLMGLYLTVVSCKKRVFALVAGWSLWRAALIGSFFQANCWCSLGSSDLVTYAGSFAPRS